MKQILTLSICILFFCLTRAQNNCNITLPYSTGFENDISNQSPTCWTTLSGEAYTFNFVYYAHSGNQLLALNSASGEAMIATPRIPLPLNQIGINLWYVDLALSTTGLLKIGFATSPTATIQWIDTLPTCDDYTYQELDFTMLSITDTGHLIFSYNNTSGTGAGLIDDITILRLSNCTPVSNLRVTDLGNTYATLVWNESENTATGCWCYIADTNNRAAAFDSIYLPAGLATHTFTSLSANTTYYVWVVADCGSDLSAEIGIQFTTTPNCGSVRNPYAISGYHTIALNWTPPATGWETTAYRIDYRAASQPLWLSDTTSVPYHFIHNLTPNTHYLYRITSICSDSLSITASGSAHTLGCTATVKDSTATHSNLPIAYSSANSYSQQIYLASELVGIDTITSITYFIANDNNIDTTPVVVYMGNTSFQQFGSSTDYVPITQLTQTFNGNIYNNGREVTINLTTPFVRTADSNLIIAIDNNLDNFATNTPSFVVGSATYRAIYRTALYDVNPASPGYGTRISFVNRIRFGTTACTLPSCEMPLPCVTTVGDNYIDIVWDADTTATYTCQYRIIGTHPWITADSAVTVGRYHYDSLDVGYSYQLRVLRLCDTDTLAATTTATLPCHPVALPYNEDFESQVLNTRFERSCWSSGTLSTNYFTLYPTITTLSASTNKLCRMTEGYIILPQFNQPLNQLQIRFDLFQTDDDDILLLGLLNDPDDTITTMTVIDTFSYHRGTGLFDTTITYRMTNLDITNGHLVFIAPLGCDNQYIDNIIISAIPDCMPIENANVTTVTATSATLNWVEEEGLSIPTAYTIEYGPRFFLPGTGIQQTAYGSSHLLSGLNHSTDYDVYIYTICSTDTTPPYGPLRFSTLCGTIVELPYLMDFEGIQNAEYSEQVLPSCWYSEALGSGTMPVLTRTIDTAQAPSGNYCLQYHGPAIVALPPFGTSIGDLKLQFHLYRDNPGTSTIIVGTVDSVTPGFATSFTPIDTIPYTTATNTHTATIYLSEHTATNSRLALRAIGPTYAHLYIDDIVVDNVTECIAPQHITLTSHTATTATIAWRTSQAMHYRIEYAPHGSSLGTGNVDTISTLGITLTNLQPGTQYDMLIQSLCDTAVSTVSHFTFRTLRGLPTTTYPYICTFADSTESNAWELENGNQRNLWCIGTATHAVANDTFSLYISDNGGMTHNYFRGETAHTYAYRAFIMTHTSYHIHYDWIAKGEGTNDFLRVFLVPAHVVFTPGYNPAGTTATNIYSIGTPEDWIALDGGTHLSNVTTWQSFDTDFDIPSPDEYYLLFYWLNNSSVGTQPPAAVDNIHITLRGCPAAQNLTYNNPTSSTISLQWEREPLSQVYLVEYGPAGFALGTGTVDTVSPGIDANSKVTVRHTLFGLESNTAYDIYVTTLCGEEWYADSIASLFNVSTLEENYYTITLLTNNDAYGFVAGGGTYAEGTVATLTATPTQGYRFDTWDDGNTDNPRYYSVTSDLTLTAIFAPDNVGIDEPSNTKKLTIYPNPTTGSITINYCQPATIIIVDLNGREIIRKDIATSTITMDLSALTPGTYFVKLADNPHCLARKILIK